MNKLFERNVHFIRKQFLLVCIFLFGLVFIFSLALTNPSPAQSYGGRPTQTRIQPGSGAFSQFGNQNWAQRVQQYHNYYGPRPLSQSIYPGFHPNNSMQSQKPKKNSISPKEEKQEKQEKANSLQAQEGSLKEKETGLKTFDKNEQIK